jgi:hypothetical protein
MLFLIFYTKLPWPIYEKTYLFQHDKFKTFVIKLNITKKVFDGRKFTYASGINYLNIFINSPPGLYIALSL